MALGEGNRSRENLFGVAVKATRAVRAGPDVLATMGVLEVRLATTTKEIRAAQTLRYRVFFREGGATAAPVARLVRRDVCRFDHVCDHLIVVDNSAKEFEGTPAVVGTYRLLRQDVAVAHFGFYSAREFHVGGLIARHPGKRFLELGRSCVADGYRGRRALELLWRGIWAYALWHRVDVMFGCASFPGADLRAHANALRFLQGGGDIDADWSVDAVGAFAAETFAADESPLDPRAGVRALPPLIKGYWKLGAKFSRGAVVDPRFGAVDVLAVLPIEAIRARYLDYFAPREETGPLAA